MLLRIDRLREARERRGWTQRELAARCGLSDIQVYRYETGRSDPSASNLRLMAEQLGISTDYLLDLTENAQSHLSEIDLDAAERDLVDTYRRDGWIGIIRLGTDRLEKNK